MKSTFISLVAVLLVTSIAVAEPQDPSSTWQTYGTENGEWRSYAGDIAGTKYSPLAQIDASNFSALELAWEWMSVDNFISRTTPSGGEWWTSLDRIVETLIEETPGLYDSNRYGPGTTYVDRSPSSSRFQATPLMIDGVLYFNTPLSQGVAIDAATGKTLWVFNPKTYEQGIPAMGSWAQRGVAYWTDGDGDERIFWGTENGYLVCVNAKNGQPCADFGSDGSGIIDAQVGIPQLERDARDHKNLMLSALMSPPIIVRDKVIHGSQLADQVIHKKQPPGWVRAWNVRTGEHEWDFHTVPNSADEYGASTWLNESWRYSGSTNVWSMLAGDNELGYVYLPTGTATNNSYGVDRLGDNLFAESIVCVDVETGQRVWHFQAVHHGLWDYDFPTHPNLVDLVVDGRPIKALLQISKQAFVYAFDRVTGEPIWPIVERPVPQDTNMPGEVLSPTQPFPTKPAPFDYQGITIDDLVDFTPEIRAMAVDVVQNFRLGPLFTPPNRPNEDGTQKTLMRPSDIGGALLAGAAVDPETGMLYIPSRNLTVEMPLYQPDPSVGATVPYTHSGGGTRYQPQMPEGLPLLKPPYSRMTAIDMNTGEHKWMVPLGNGDRIRNHPRLRHLNLPPLGNGTIAGPVLTKTLLISSLTEGGSNGGPRLVAWDKQTGVERGSIDLSFATIGTPMTYMVGDKQYIAVTIGGGPRLVAFALPD